MSQDSSQPKQPIRKSESLANRHQKFKLTNQKVSLVPIFSTISQVKVFVCFEGATVLFIKIVGL